jgi:hypothetical protein
MFRTDSQAETQAENSGKLRSKTPVIRVTEIQASHLSIKE